MFGSSAVCSEPIMCGKGTKNKTLKETSRAVGYINCLYSVFFGMFHSEGVSAQHALRRTALNTCHLTPKEKEDL